ncbi:hypothetical protein TUM4261_24440 [Shewanella sp. c952]|nr:hypothetical protein TUM4261_24440 [Shewanella sp. c952]
MSKRRLASDMTACSLLHNSFISTFIERAENKKACLLSTDMLLKGIYKPFNWRVN